MASTSTTGMETYTIEGVRYEIPKAVAEMLQSSKSHLQVIVFNHKSARFLEYCGGVGSIGEKEMVDVSGIMEGLEVAHVIEEVPAGGCNCRVSFVEADEEELEICEAVDVMVENPGGVDIADIEDLEKGDAVAVENPEGVSVVAAEGVADSDDTNFWFGCSQEEGNVAGAGDDTQFNEEMSTANQVLKNLVEMGKIAQFKENNEAEDMDCEIVQPTGAVSKRKKKELPLRIQPTREVGKRKQAVKEEAIVGKPVKKQKRSKSGREILQEVECCEEFLMKEGLTEILDLLEVQGWRNLCETMDFVCPEVVEDFYKDLRLINDAVPSLEVNFRGKKFTVSSTQLATILGLKHEGFDFYCKTSVWPKELGDKKQMVREICQLESTQKGIGISTQFMEPTVKILHKLLVSNFMQRGVKPSYVQHQDLLLLDRLLKKEQINLPKLMIYQIDHLKNLTQIGYSRVIKRVLEAHNLYEISSGNEEQIVKDFDPDVFRKMNLVKDHVEGWIKNPVPEQKKKAKPVVQEVEELTDSENEAEDDNSKLIKIFEKVVSDLRSELREFKREVKEAIQDMKGELTTLINKL